MRMRMRAVLHTCCVGQVAHHPRRPLHTLLQRCMHWIASHYMVHLSLKTDKSNFSRNLIADSMYCKN
jgi:hypothetical protein